MAWQLGVGRGGDGERATCSLIVLDGRATGGGPGSRHRGDVGWGVGGASGFGLGLKVGEMKGCSFEIHWPCVSLCQCVFSSLCLLGDRRQAQLFKLESFQNSQLVQH